MCRLEVTGLLTSTYATSATAELPSVPRLLCNRPGVLLLFHVEVVRPNITVSAPVFTGERTNGLELRKGPFGQVPGLGFHCAQHTPKFLKEKQPSAQWWICIN